MTVDNANNFYIATGSLVDPTLPTCAVSPFLIIARTLDSFICGNLPLFLPDTRDVALNAANDLAYVTIAGFNSVVAFSLNPAEGIPLVACLPPLAGDWHINQDCAISGSVDVPANVNVIVDPGMTLTINDSASLNMNLEANHLIVRDGGKVVIKNGGKIE